MLANYYAQAVYELIADGMKVKDAVAHLEKVLKQKGHTKLSRQILRTLYRIAEQEESFDMPVLTVKEQSQRAAFRKEIAATLKEFGTSDDRLETEEDANLVGGFTITYKGIEVDRSYKTQLVDLYRRVTT